jgi:predicted CoA-binding protein
MSCDIAILKKLFVETKVIAVIGLSPKPDRTSHWISEYLQESGYQIIPVYPTQSTILGETVYRSIADITIAVDMVMIFRRSENVLPLINEALRLDPLPGSIWLPEGVRSREGEAIAEAVGVHFIENCCFYKVHQDYC